METIKSSMNIGGNEYAAGIDEQIRFLKSERNRLLLIVGTLNDKEMNGVLMKKVRIYTDLEQNMYALRALASQIYRNEKNKYSCS